MTRCSFEFMNSKYLTRRESSSPPFKLVRAVGGFFGWLAQGVVRKSSGRSRRGPERVA